MNETHLQPARAFHDLNGVTAIEIIGWPGRSEVRAHDEHGVAIITPRRVDGEFWTFQQQQDGSLRCFSDLIGDPHLLTDPGEPMVILLPADRIGAISVRMARMLTHEKYDGLIAPVTAKEA